MRFASIASGSSGNCIYTGSDHTHLLIDAGISAKKIDQGLRELGLSGSDVSGILITHEHTDHICGLGVLLRKYQIPVYATERTIKRILATSSLGAMSRELFCPICPDEPFEIGDLSVCLIDFLGKVRQCFLIYRTKCCEICFQLTVAFAIGIQSFVFLLIQRSVFQIGGQSLDLSPQLLDLLCGIRGLLL